MLIELGSLCSKGRSGVPYQKSAMRVVLWSKGSLSNFRATQELLSCTNVPKGTLCGFERDTPQRDTLGTSKVSASCNSL